MATKTPPKPRTSARAKVVPITAKGKGEPTGEITVRPTLDASDAPFYYVNFMEVAHSAHDFSIFSARLPSKLSSDQLAGAAAKAGVLEVPADLHITFAPRVAAGLLRALTKQIEAYEKAHGAIQQEKPNE